MWHNLERPIKSQSSIKAKGDVASRGVFDCRSSLKAGRGGGGNMTHSYSSANCF